MRKKKQPRPKDISIHAVKGKHRKAAASSKRSSNEVWERLMKIGEELGEGWQSKKSAVEILSEMRR
jgi:hypothetical protein